MIDQNDVISTLYSQQVDDLPLELSLDTPNGEYEFALLDANQQALSTLRFEVDFHTTHGESDFLPLVLTMPLPGASTAFEIRKAGQTLYRLDFSAQAPVVSNIIAVDNGQGGIDLQWQASDQDSQTLTFNLFFQENPTAVSQLIATDLTETSFFFDTSIAPATSDGQFIVEASDGYNKASGVSNSFSISEKPPLAVIVSPESGAELVAGQSITLAGGGYDFTTGLLEGDALAWRSDRDGFLGTGSQLEAHLSAGLHTLSLVATAPNGLEDTYSIEINVLADTDGDEVRLGSDPVDKQSLPSPSLVYPSTDEIDLGQCRNNANSILTVQTSSPDVSWKVATDVSWLSATGDGAGDGNVTLTANCETLPDDKYTGRLLISSQGKQLEVIEVSMIVNRHVYLPLILK